VYNEYTQKLNPYFPAYLDIKSDDEVDALYLALYGAIYHTRGWTEGRLLYPWNKEAVGEEVSAQMEWYKEKYSYTEIELYLRVLHVYLDKKVDAGEMALFRAESENSVALRMPQNLVGLSQECLARVASNLYRNEYPRYVSTGVLPFYNLRMLDYLLSHARIYLPENPLVENKKLTVTGTEVCTLLKLKPRKFLEYLCAPPVEQSSATGRTHQSVLRLNTKGELYVYSKYPCRV
jgi:hypothetical protein